MNFKATLRNPKSALANLSLFICFIFFMTLQAQNPNNNVDGGVISTEDNTAVCLDGTPQLIDVNLEGNSGRRSQWIITDELNNILGLPPSPPFDFGGAGEGICRIWHLSYNGIRPLRMTHNLDDLRGRYDLSNYIEVIRTNKPEGGTLTGGDNNSFTFCIDGEADNIPEGAITLEGNTGTNSRWVVTDDNLNILGLPPSPSIPNFDGAGPGVCLIWHLSFEGDPETFLAVDNAAELSGCFDLSNPITVIRYQPDGGVISGGDNNTFTFCIDGEADNIPEGAITLEDNEGVLSQWVVTDDTGIILGLPPSPSIPNFDGAGPGTCLIYHLSAFGDVEGLQGQSNIGDLSGCFDLSNPISVIRYQSEGGTISGGDNNTFTFCVDGEADNIPEGAVTLEGNEGSLSQWVVTDDTGVILGLPPSPSAPNFDGAGAGTCFVYHLSAFGNVDGLQPQSNIADLSGCFDLSNYITVIRYQADGGTLTGGENNTFNFVIDDEADNIPEGAITLEGQEGSLSQWVVTDDSGNILGLPPSPYAPDFNGAGTGTCFVYHLSAFGDVEGLEPQANIADLSGCYDLSNAITVVRTASNSSRVTVYPNPVSEVLIIKTEKVDVFEKSIKIYNSTYNEVYEGVIKSNRTEIDVRRFTKGLYFVNIRDSKGLDEIIKVIVN